jgi:CRISPR-associated protein Cas2
MLIVVSYDVPDDRRRTRLAHALQDFGTRVQLSVFECVLTPDQEDRLRSRLLRLIDPEEDNVRIYRLCETCRTKIEIQGRGSRTEDPSLYVL